MKKSFDDAERYRVQIPGFPANRPGDREGCFVITDGKCQLRMIMNDGIDTGWEHVSVSLKVRLDSGEIVDRLPTWDMMTVAKNLFWDAEECVLQFHPPASEYVNRHEFVLHLWRQLGRNHPTPPKILV